MMVKRIVLFAGIIGLLAGCAGNQKPLVYKHPETKNIVLLQGDTLKCEPLFRKAGFQRIDAGSIE